MASVSLKLDQLFILLVPELIEFVVGAVSFPNEPDFVQKSLSIKSKFVLLMILSLLTNPLPQRRVLLVEIWHCTMAILSFKFDKLFIHYIPSLIMFRHGSQGTFKERN
jgi:hypothetical protein